MNPQSSNESEERVHLTNSYYWTHAAKIQERALGFVPPPSSLIQKYYCILLWYFLPEARFWFPHNTLSSALWSFHHRSLPSDTVSQFMLSLLISPSQYWQSHKPVTVHLTHWVLLLLMDTTWNRRQEKTLYRKSDDNACTLVPFETRI